MLKQYEKPIPSHNLKIIVTNPLLSSSPGKPTALAQIDTLDYIYAILHSPTYRKKYKEFLSETSREIMGSGIISKK